MAEDTKKEPATEAAGLHDDMGLKLKHRYSFRPANSSPAIVGTLVGVASAGYVVKQDGMNHTTFLPIHNVFAVEPAD